MPGASPLGRARLDVRLLDLSRTGACIEHLDLLRPGSTCTLEFPPALGPLVVSGRVVWSSIVGTEPSPEGERVLRYQTGLVFVGVTAEQQATLASALERLTRGMGLEGGRLAL